MTTVDIALVTWPNRPARLAYFERTVLTLKANLTATGHTVRWLCSSESERDPDREWCGEGLAAFCERYEIELSWRDGPASPGGNMNRAMQLGCGDVILLHQDDWLLRQPLDIGPGVDLLLANRDVDLVRYSFPQNEKQRPTLVPWQSGWVKFDLQGQWPYGDDPHLRRRDALDKWGLYAENKGFAEGDFLRRLVAGNALIVGPGVSYYAHCGQITTVPNDTRWTTKTR